MDAHNLATLFGPNLLHKAKGGEYEVETPERAEERKDVIAVIQDMIASFDEFYQVSSTSLMLAFNLLSHKKKLISICMFLCWLPNSVV